MPKQIGTNSGKGKGLTDAQKDAVAYGLMAVGSYLLFKKMQYAIMGEPGPTTQVKYDFDRTQQICSYAPTGAGEHKLLCVDDEWTPTEIANRLFSNMSGINKPDFIDTERGKAWRDVSRLGFDRLKWLHNYWLKNKDSADTVYRWIRGESVVKWTPEYYDKYAALDKLTRAGVGF